MVKQIFWELVIPSLRIVSVHQYGTGKLENYAVRSCHIPGLAGSIGLVLGKE